jgi:hypothetical protein
LCEISIYDAEVFGLGELAAEPGCWRWGRGAYFRMAGIADTLSRCRRWQLVSSMMAELPPFRY